MLTGKIFLFQIHSTTTTPTRLTGLLIPLLGKLMDKLEELRRSLRLGTRLLTNGCSPRHLLVSNFHYGLLVFLPTAKAPLIGLVDWSTGTLKISSRTDTTMLHSNLLLSLATTLPRALELTRACRTNITVTLVPTIQLLTVPTPPCSARSWLQVPTRLLVPLHHQEHRALNPQRQPRRCQVLQVATQVSTHILAPLQEAQVEPQLKQPAAAPRVARHRPTTASVKEIQGRRARVVQRSWVLGKKN